MRNVLVSTLAILSLLLVVSVVSATPLAPDYTKVGVKVGDIAVYHTVYSGSPDYVNKTTVEFYGTVGTEVTIHRNEYAPSGVHVSFASITGDISDGTGYAMYQYLVTPGLAVGDPIYSGAGFTINDTHQMTVAGASRSINHIRIFGGSPEVYWDQVTGLTTEVHVYMFSYWWNMTLISTTVWQPYTPPSLLNPVTISLILVVVVCVLLVALVYVMRKGRRSRRKK